MAYVPEDTKWYLADLIVEIKIEDEPRNTIHTNTVLIRADSPEDAYNKALELGDEENTEYDNPEGKLVVFKFRGIKDLYAIYDDLEHGSELFYNEDFEVPEDEIVKMLRPKEKLSVFTPVEKESKPNYVSKEIYEDLLKAGFTKEELE